MVPISYKFAPAFLFFLITSSENAYSHAQVKIPDGFLQTSGHNLKVDNTLFYTDGFNAYWLMSVGSDPKQRCKVTDALKQARAVGLTTCRTWAFSDGGINPLQISPGVYNEQMFQGLDFAISEAKIHGIRLILSLVNNYKEYGGKGQYVQWARERGQKLTSDDDFFNSTMVKTFYKDHIKVVLTRFNHISKVLYKADPTIMSWELMNEPRCTSDLSGKSIQDWIEEMASYVKSLDANHLLEVGLEGFYGNASPHRVQYNPLKYQVGTDFIANNRVSHIDFVTVHSYPDYWLGNTSSNEVQMQFLSKWVAIHIFDSLNILKKPVMFTEFGKSSRDPNFLTLQRDEMFNFMFTAVENSKKTNGPVSGALFWQLLAAGMDNYRDGNEIVFREQNSSDILIARHARKLRIL